MQVHDTNARMLGGRAPAEERVVVAAEPDTAGLQIGSCGEREDRRRLVLSALSLGCGVGPGLGSQGCELKTLRGLTGIDLAVLEDEVLYLEGEGYVEIEDLAAPRPRLRVQITATGGRYLAGRYLIESHQVKRCQQNGEKG